MKVVVENALNQNKMLKPAEAAKLGIFDELLESADFLAESLRWAAKVIDGSTPIVRREVDRDQAWDAVIHDKASKNGNSVDI